MSRSVMVLRGGARSLGDQVHWEETHTAPPKAGKFTTPPCLLESQLQGDGYPYMQCFSDFIMITVF